MIRTTVASDEVNKEYQGNEEKSHPKTGRKSESVVDIRCMRQQPRRHDRLHLHRRAIRSSAVQPASLSLEFGSLNYRMNPYAATRLNGQRIIFEFPKRLYDEVLRDFTVSPPRAVQ